MVLELVVEALGDETATPLCLGSCSDGGGKNVHAPQAATAHTPGDSNKTVLQPQPILIPRPSQAGERAWYLH